MVSRPVINKPIGYNQLNVLLSVFYPLDFFSSAVASIERIFVKSYLCRLVSFEFSSSNVFVNNQHVREERGTFNEIIYPTALGRVLREIV